MSWQQSLKTDAEREMSAVLNRCQGNLQRSEKVPWRNEPQHPPRHVFARAIHNGCEENKGLVVPGSAEQRAGGRVLERRSAALRGAPSRARASPSERSLEARRARGEAESTRTTRTRGRDPPTGLD